MLKVDNKEPLSSGEHYSGADEARWDYTESIVSADFLAECRQGLMEHLANINSVYFYNDELYAITAPSSAVFYKRANDSLSSSQKKEAGLNLEWLMKEHGVTSMYSTSHDGMLRFGGGLGEMPIMSDIRMVGARIDLQGSFSEDKGWYEYSDWTRVPHWEKISTGGGLWSGVIEIRAILKDYQIVSGCIYVDCVFPEFTKRMGIDAPACCWPETKQVQTVFFNGETAKHIDMFGTPIPQSDPDI